MMTSLEVLRKVNREKERAPLYPTSPLNILRRYNLQNKLKKNREALLKHLR